MDKLVIQGGNKLYGSVTIGGAKNAVVALLPATLLARDIVVLENVPAIRDVRIMLGIMGQLGAQIKMLDKTTYQIDTRHIEYQVVPNEVAKRLRASYYLICAMLGTFGDAASTATLRMEAATGAGAFLILVCLGVEMVVLSRRLPQE